MGFWFRDFLSNLIFLEGLLIKRIFLLECKLLQIVMNSRILEF
jgi:hypothetical protein